MLAGQALYRDLQRQWSFAAAPAAVADSAFVSFCLSAEAPLKTPPWKVKSEVLFLRKQRAEVWPELLQNGAFPGLWGSKAGKVNMPSRGRHRASAYNAVQVRQGDAQNH